MYSTIFFARKEIDSKTGKEYFMDIGSDIRFTKAFGPGPYYEIH